ncbi:WD40-repeat-containing domain protein [Suillus ampliporus]|nr:WD40-repeat-containing domain protein [Suillus ampliporus]
MSTPPRPTPSSGSTKKAAQPITPITTPVRVFTGHEDTLKAVAVLPDKARMVTSSADKTLRLWDLENGVSLKKMKGHRKSARAVAVSRDGRLIASGDEDGELIAWDGNTGKSLRRITEWTTNATLHKEINSLDFSPNGAELAVGSEDMTKLWSTKTWQLQGTIEHKYPNHVNCVQYSPSGKLLAIATFREVQIWNPRTTQGSEKDRLLAWTPDGTRLLSAGYDRDPTIRVWDSSTWKQVCHPWKVDDYMFDPIEAIAVNPNSTLVACAYSNFVYLWRFSDKQIIAKFSTTANCATFSTDGKHIFGGCYDGTISQWAVPGLPGDMSGQETINLNSSLPRSDHLHDAQIQNLRPKYVGAPPETERLIWKVIDAQLEDTPLCLLNTLTGRLCNREAQINAFGTSAEYKQLWSLPADLRMDRIKEVVGMYFRYVMLSHRWEGKEPLLQDIQDKVVYDLNALDGIAKLQSFCKIAHYVTQLHMFPPSSKSGALANSAWNTRGWTVPEFLAPKVILFYQQDWTLYLDDNSPNHKDSAAIMRELEDATGIDAPALVAFQPGMGGAREKLRWASTRVTTRPEDIAYSLFGIFGVHLPIIYGEKKHNALGRLLQEIVARSGDVSALDWVGKSSEFNSCLPADITSYQDPPCILSSPSERRIQTLISSLQNTVVIESASKLYTMLDSLSSPRFANCRLHLPCIVFPVTDIRRRQGEEEETYGVKADGLHDLLITTEDKLIPFSHSRPIRQTFLLVRPWNRDLLDLPDYTDDSLNVDDSPLLESPLQGSPRSSHELGDSEAHSRALRLIARLGQQFSAILLVQHRSGEYKRIASDHDIIVQVKDMASMPDITEIRTLEIL